MKRLLKKTLVIMLSVATFVSSMTSAVYASDDLAIPEETPAVEMSSEEAAEETFVSEEPEETEAEGPAEVPSEDAIVYEASAEEDTTSSQAAVQDLPAEESTEETETIAEESITEETTDEGTAKEESQPEEEPSVYGEVDLSLAYGVDLSSGRLLVSGAEIIDREYLISSYNGLDMLQYTDLETVTEAYCYYLVNASMVMPDTTAMYVADGEEEAMTPIESSEIMSEGDNPLDRIHENSGIGYGYDIALIDTGAAAGAAVSVIGDETGDFNGHGSEMLNAIYSQNPYASVLSVKAFDSSGSADVSAVYAAFELAINAGVRIINFSASAWATEENAIIADEIAKAAAGGIIVVGAAGNNGTSASFMVPGYVGSAFIIGAADEYGVRLPSSNYGETVDYNVAAQSTSYAAAIFSGWISANGLTAVGEVLNKGLIYEPGRTEEDVENDRINYTGQFEVQDPESPFSNPTGDWHANGDYSANYYHYFTHNDLTASFNPSDFSVGDVISVDGIFDSDYYAGWNDASWGDLAEHYGWGSGYDPYYGASDFVSLRWGYPFLITASNDYRISNIAASSGGWLQLVCVAPNMSDAFASGPVVNSAQLYVRDIGSDGSLYCFLYVSVSNPNGYGTAQDKGMFVKVSPAGGYIALHKSAASGSLAPEDLYGAVYEIKDEWGSHVGAFAIGERGQGFTIGLISSGATPASNSGMAGSDPAFPIHEWFNQEWGWTYQTTISLPAGTYYATELAPPVSGKYQLNSESVAVTVSPGETSTFYVTDEPNPASAVTVRKTTSNAACTAQLSGNAMYSQDYSGAQFSVTYTDFENNTKTVTKTTGSNGTFTIDDALTGSTMTVKETKAPKGYLLPSDPVKTITVQEGTNMITFADEPTLDPDWLTLNKVKFVNGRMVVAEKVAGAIFKVEYFASASPSGTATRTWYYETQDNGSINFRRESNLTNNAGYPSDERYHSGSGDITLPLGSVRVTEVYSPAGYKLVSDPITGTITQDANGRADVSWTIPSSNQIRTESDGTITVADEEKYGGFTITKADADSSSVQGDASFNGVEVTIKNVSGKSIRLNDGTPVANNGTVTTLTFANGSSTVSTGAVLPLGKYEVTETKGSTDGAYKRNTSWKVTVEMEDDGSASLKPDKSTSELTVSDQIIKGGVRVEKEDSLGSTAQGDATLAGAEFTIYNNSTNPVTVNGTSYAKGAAVATITTNASGVAASSSSLLPYGSYTIKETKAPTGYKLNSSWSKTFTIRTNGTVVDLTSDKVSEEAIRGGVKVSKVDADLNSGTAQGDATLAGAEFTIYNNSTNPVVVGGTTYAKGAAVATITSNASGTAATASNALPYGTYYVKETKAPTGYKLNRSWRKDFTVRENGVVVDASDDSVSDEVIRGGVKVAKVDADLEEGTAQGDATLAGAEFTIYNNSTNPVTVNGTSYAKGAAVMTITTTANGISQTRADALPYGTYYVKETKAPAGYKLNSTWRKDFTIRTDGKVVDVTDDPVSDEVIRGGVKTGKTDSETGAAKAQGWAALEGAEITIYNNSSRSVVVGGTEYAKGAAVLTITTDADGMAQTEADALPYGTYYLKETKAPEGYNPNSTWRVDFQIREDGVIVDTTAEESGGKVADDIIRADIEFSKIDIDGHKMAGIPFIIERLDRDNETAVESHVIVADENGFTSTAVRSKTDSKVNSLDSYVSDGTFTDESALDGTANVWFGEQGARDDSRGSLIYGNYRVTELRCEANAGMDMLSQFMLSVDQAGNISTYFTEGRTFSLGAVFVNLIVHPESDLTDDATGSKVVSSGSSVSVTDAFRYDHLKTTKTYKLVTEIYREDRDGSISEEPIGSNEITFTPAAVDATETANGTVDNPVIINTESFSGQGGKLHAVDMLYVLGDDGEYVLIASHNTDMDEERQMLYVPYISTIAKDNATGDHVGSLSEDAQVIDTVSYENLRADGMYILEGTLRYADTGEAVTGTDGNPCVKTLTLRISANVSSVSYRANGMAVGPKDGEIEMPAFTFDSTDMKGRTLVVTEVLYDYDTEAVVAEHYDLADEEQSIHIPEITTEAADAETGTHTAVVGTTVIRDKVTMTNLVPGMEYKVTGDLVYKADCTDSAGNEHKAGDVIASHAPVTITAESATEVIYLDYAVDASALEGISGVVFEDAFHNDVPVATHHDLESEEQTVNWPKVRTTASDGQTGTHTGVAGEEATIVDVVELANLTVGDTYRLIGTLMNTDGTPFMLNGEEVTFTSTAFKAEGADMNVSMTFTFDASEAAGASLVVFEKLICVSEDEGGAEKETEVARHEDLNDLGQTVDYPEVRTNASDSKTGDHAGTVGEMETIVDVVTYSNVHVGEEYTVTGTLHYKEDFTGADGASHLAGDALTDTEGKTITASVTFVAEQKEGTVELVYNLDSSLLSGTSVVVFEDLINNNVKAASHADLEDGDQRIDYPDVHTTASDSLTKDHVGTTDAAAITDEVKLENLHVGYTYSVSGKVMDKETGKPFLDRNGNEITAESGDFEATAESMTITLTFNIDADTLDGMSLVVFEDLFHNGIEVAVHEVTSDEDQTVHYPEVRTTAVDGDTADIVGTDKENATITDTVTVTNLIPGEEYTITGRLFDQANGAEVQQKSIVMTPVTFTAEKSEEVHEITFTGINSMLLKGHSLVVFEDLLHKDEVVADHSDITDTAQTVNYPEVRTNAVDSSTGGHAGTIFGKFINAVRKMLGFDVLEEDEQQVVDTVSLTNLVNGKTYTVEGILKDKTTGESILVDGKEITQNAEVVVKNGKITAPGGEKVTTTKYDETAQTVSGTVDLVFTFDSSVLTAYGTDGEASASVVAFETLKFNGIEVAAHADLGDENQTVTDVAVHTTATDAATGDHVGDSPSAKADHAGIEDAKQSVIRDAVQLEGLVPGEDYVLEGKLVLTGQCTADKAVYLKTGGTATEDAAEAITVTKQFIAEKASDTVTLEFTVTSELVAGQAVTVFENLYHNGVLISAHADYTDEDQTVWYPQIRTELKDRATGSHHAYAQKGMTLIDTVTYSNLIVGEEYTFSGILYDKDTGKPFLDDNGKEVRSEPVTIKATKADGSVEIMFTFDGATLAGRETVAFETLEHNGVPVAVHADLSDEAQTVRIPEIRTSLKTEADSNEVRASAEMVLVDTVSYSKLYPGTKYVITGTLMDKETGKAAADDSGNKITAKAEFTPETESGTVEVVFRFSGLKFKGQSLVAFEALKEVGVGKTIADHKDLKDEEQTVTVPEIKTTLTGKDGGKYIIATKEIELVDTVTYSNLRTDGRRYTLNGKLVDKATGESILDDSGREVVSSVTFVPKKASGSVKMTFRFNGKLIAGKDIVAFESLTTEYGEVAVHADINDKAQTVQVPGIGTTLTNKKNGSHVINANEEIILNDEVAYRNFETGYTYTVTGFLYDVSGGTPVPVTDESGSIITGHTTFTPKAKDGSVNVEFSFENKLLGGAIVVCFEYVTVGSEAVKEITSKTELYAEHADKDDQAQMVRMPYISTELTMKGGAKEFTVTESTTSLGFNDAVKLNNLDLGDTYRIEGMLLNKTNGMYIKADGTDTANADEAYKVSKTFKVTQNFDGKINLQFEFNTAAACGNLKHDIVCYESLYVIGTDGSETLVAGETDLASELQSVTYKETPAASIPATGIFTIKGIFIPLMAGFIGLAIIAFVLLMILRRRWKQ